MLHVATLPFPTHQGTQAALACMLQTLARHGRDSQLLTYAHAGHAAEFAFPVHRSSELLRYRSLRSGPTAHRLLADAALARALGRLSDQLDPEVIVAHHVEATAIAAASRAGARRALVFFAHTDLGAELPCYAPRLFAPLLRSAGGAVDAALVRRAHAVAAISPLLATRLRELAGDDPDKVYFVPPPWPVPPPNGAEERASSRAALGIDPRARVLLYAGNLDPYQGWESLLGAVAALRAREPALVWLVATRSNPARLLAETQRAGLRALLALRPLDGEAERRMLHAAADVAVVPRRAPGGLPIKLLDAMARGIPCVATPTATAGLKLGDAVVQAEGDHADAMAAATLRVLSLATAPRVALGARARDYVAAHHGPAAFLRAFDAVCATARRRVARAHQEAARAQLF